MCTFAGVSLFLHYAFSICIYLLSVIPFEFILYVIQSKKMEVSLENKMLDAVSSQDLETVSLLLSQGANPNKTTSNGKTCLGEAVFKGYADIAKKLIAETANTVQPMDNKEQEDKASVNENRQTMLRSFKKKLAKPPLDGSAVSLTPTSPQTELEWDEDIGSVAATTSEDESVATMYKWYATILESTGSAIAAASDYTCGLDQQDAFGKVALNYAVDGNNLEMVKELIENGCKVDFVGSNGWTPLHTSVAKNRLDIARMLVEAGSNVNLRTPIKTSALHIAACHNVELVILIADHGASLDLRDEKDRTALFIGAAQGHTAVVNFLMERGANINIGDLDGHTPLCKAVMFKHYETVKLLLEGGARITHYQCLLQTAIRQENMDMIILLANHGCGINVHNSDGETPLLFAMTLGDPYEIVSILLEKGANANATNSQTGANALHLAVEFCEERDKFEKLLNLLIDYNIDLDRRASTHDTALNRAILLHKDRIAMQLIRYGADVNLCEVLTNVFGNLIIASNRKGIKLANMLIKAGHNRVTLNLNNNPSKTARWITQMFKRPLNLAGICRIHVRDLHGDISLRDYVASLPIPDIIKKYLMMEELNV